MKTHHIHAAPSADKNDAPVSFDVGPARVRLEGGTRDERAEIVRRAVVTWNMHEGIPTDVLEEGRVRAFYDAVQALLNCLEASHWEGVEARRVRQAWEAVTIEFTADGRRAECECSEKVTP